MIDFSAPIDGSKTLGQFFEWAMPELTETKSPATIRDYQSFFAHWRRITGDPPMQDVTRDDLYAFRQRLLEESWTDEHGRVHVPVAPKTVHKHHGYFRFFFSKAVDLGLVTQIPQLYVFRKSVLSPEQARVRSKQARDIINAGETIRLFHGCSAATYPFRERNHKISGLHRVLLWRALFYFAWLYGIRQSDLKTISWECFDFTPAQNAPHGMLLFEPWKLRRKGRLQGLPLTELGRVVLQALSEHPKSLFPELLICEGPLFRFLSSNRGSWNRPRNGEAPHWIEGWSACLQRDICATQGILPTIGPEWLLREVQSRADAVPAITLHVFRQTAVTQYNDFRSDTGRRMGRFIAGHTGGAVDEQSYDKPTAAVWDAICEREAQHLPPIWREWFAAQTSF